MLERFRKALAATHSIKNPARLSIATALELFHMVISPAASYGIAVCWEKLTVSDIALLDRIKPTFLKRVLGLHRSALNRFVYLLVDTPLYVEELTKQFGLRETEAYTKFLRIYEEKLASVDGGLFDTIGMNSSDWKGANQKSRHLIARLAAHGFHERLCTKPRCYEPDRDCICRRCGQTCPRYHASHCTFVKSLARLAEVD